MRYLLASLLVVLVSVSARAGHMEPVVASQFPYPLLRAQGTTVTNDLAVFCSISGISGACDANVAIGTAGSAVPVMSAANTWTGVQTYTAMPVFTGTANAIAPVGSAAGAPVGFQASGTDTNIAVNIQPKGTGAFIFGLIPDGTTTGGNTRGAYAVDLQNVRFNATQAASGQSAVVAGGSSNQASGNTSTVGGGYNNTASATGATVPGGFNNTADGAYSFAYGFRANAFGRYGWQGAASGLFSAGSYVAQAGTSVLRATSTSTSAVRLTADQAAAGAANCLNIPVNTTYNLRLSLTGHDRTTAATYYAWTVPVAVLHRDGTFGSTTVALGTPTTLSAGTVTGIAVSVTADTTNGCLNATVTPPTSDAWDWVLRADSTEAQ